MPSIIIAYPRTFKKESSFHGLFPELAYKELLPTHLPIYLSIYLSIYNIYLVYLSIYLDLCLSNRRSATWLSVVLQANWTPLLLGLPMARIRDGGLIFVWFGFERIPTSIFLNWASLGLRLNRLLLDQLRTVWPLLEKKLVFVWGRIERI